MKKYLVLTGIFILSISNSRAQFYTFYQDTIAYSNLTSPTVISTPGWDYLSVYPVPIPFNFQFYGIPFDTFYVAGGFGGFEYDVVNQFGDNQISFYDAPLIDRGVGLSTISYEITGSAPGRTLKLQLDNAGFQDDLIELDFVNVQLWFYEGSNIVEIHNGPNSVVNPDSWYQTGCFGPWISLAKDSTTFIQLHGPSSHPSPSTTFIAYCVTDAPPETIVYGFEPLNSGISEISNSSVNIFPNPNNGEFSIHVPDLKSSALISIYNLEGQLVYYEKILSTENVRISAKLNPGIYLLKVSSNEKQFVKPLVVGL